MHVGFSLMAMPFAVGAIMDADNRSLKTVSQCRSLSGFVAMSNKTNCSIFFYCVQLVFYHGLICI